MGSTKIKNPKTKKLSEHELKALIEKSEKGPFYTSQQIKDEVKKWKSNHEK
jgi:hypothetical protein